MTVDGPRVIGSMRGSACFIDLGFGSQRFVVPDGMAVLVADAAGVHVNLRPPWFEKLTRATINGPFSRFRREDFWYGRWDEIVSVRVAGLAMVLENSGRERCYFAAQTPSEMNACLGELAAHGVPMQTVRSVYWEMFRRRRKLHR
ncbi:hypothetical protein CELL_01980 [Cellulomonas sp. T2.31MG-18]|uniref:hypothetical protein n=1 Tax=Cellulomonas sp. T2.31MG-18 TaxID=3157619 RepID=UPI0035EAC781